MAIKNPDEPKPSKENATKPMVVKNDPTAPPIPTPPQLTPEQMNEIKEFAPEQFFQIHKQRLRKIKNMTEIISIASICLLALVIILSILAVVLTIIEIDAIDQFQQNVTGTNWYRDPCRLCFPVDDSVFKSQLKRIRFLSGEKEIDLTTCIMPNPSTWICYDFKREKGEVTLDQSRSFNCLTQK